MSVLIALAALTEPIKIIREILSAWQRAGIQTQE